MAPTESRTTAPTTAPTTAVLHPSFAVGTLDRRLFGSFVEHMGRSVYTGIVEPGHPAADDAGRRQDVLDLVRELGVSLVRYPGGNFVSGYRWEDGIGPVDQRPTRLDLAWRSIETNTFGIDEFIEWARLASVEPMLAVNLGTRGIQEAADFVEYCNHPSGTRLSDLRRANGADKPHDVLLWCLGNEMDGPWQIGHKTAEEYGRLAAESARAMKLVDPRIELVACGSSNRRMPTYGSWERTVLEHTYREVDYLSLHAYYEQDGDLRSFLASAVDMDGFISDVAATADAVGAQLHESKRLRLSFDEWNVWNETDFVGAPNLHWTEAPRLIEDAYSLADAVVVGDFLITLLRHADRVAIGALAQLVNVIAPIRTEPGGPSWRQTIFWPFALTAALARGEVLRVEPDGPSIDTERFGRVPALSATATRDDDTGRISVFAVNRDTEAPHTLRLDIHALGPVQPTSTWLLGDDDEYAVNDAEHPDRVRPTALRNVRCADGVLEVELPPVAWAAVELSPA